MINTHFLQTDAAEEWLIRVTDDNDPEENSVTMTEEEARATIRQLTDALERLPALYAATVGMSEVE
jgi:DNA-directed RNA polymerase specialized sigma24 family protein